MRKAVSLAILMSVSALSGCSWAERTFSSNDSAQEADAAGLRLNQMIVETNSCVAAKSASRVETSFCVNRAFQSAMYDIRYPYPDIVATLSAERLRVAEQIDKNVISQAEGLARISDKLAEVIRVERARNSSVAAKGDGTPPQYFLQILLTGL